eukprot:m.347517 g.347517  ORF g.347517 m.347517 type:complete len:431 (-) comp27925_c0_seq2:1271-2563(-)
MAALICGTLSAATCVRRATTCAAASSTAAVESAISAWAAGLCGHVLAPLLVTIRERSCSRASIFAFSSAKTVSLSVTSRWAATVSGWSSNPKISGCARVNLFSAASRAIAASTTPASPLLLTTAFLTLPHALTDFDSNFWNDARCCGCASKKLSDTSVDMVPQCRSTTHTLRSRTRSSSARFWDRSSLRFAVLSPRTLVPSAKIFEPSAKILVPSAKTFVPSAKTLVPSANTLVPSGSMVEPSAKTCVPSAKILEPSGEIFVPSDKTRDPSASTLVPSASTRVPSARTFVPSERSFVPSESTFEPSARTRVPSARTRDPSARTRVPSAKTTSSREFPMRLPVASYIVPSAWICRPSASTRSLIFELECVTLFRAFRRVGLSLRVGIRMRWGKPDRGGDVSEGRGKAKGWEHVGVGVNPEWRGRVWLRCAN